MIHIERKPAPPVFSSSIWQREQKTAVEYFTKSIEERRHAQFSFKFFRHQEFTTDGIVRPAENAKGQASKKGSESIFVYALSRPDLIDERAKRAKDILAQIERVKEASLNVRDYPGSARFKNALRRELKVLKDFRRSDMEYAALARQVTDEFLKSI